MVQTLRENQKRGRPKSGWIEDSMQATGMSRRAVQLYAEIGEKVAHDVIAQIRRTSLDKLTYLKTLKDLSHADQRAKVEYDLLHGLPKRPRSNLTPLQKAWLDADEDERVDFLSWMGAE
jgi:hypothetical protein